MQVNSRDAFLAPCYAISSTINEASVGVIPSEQISPLPEADFIVMMQQRAMDCRNVWKKLAALEIYGTAEGVGI
jgi:hypothetical protein